VMYLTGKLVSLVPRAGEDRVRLAHAVIDAFDAVLSEEVLLGSQTARAASCRPC
jgi:hypothetical protein